MNNQFFGDERDFYKYGILKEKLQQQYDEQKKLEDYDIFMVIAENIGYDATGRNTNNNELDFIGKELKRFIKHLEGEK